MQEVGRYNSSIKVVFFDDPDKDEDWTLNELLMQTNDICPIVRTDEQLLMDEEKLLASMTEEQRSQAILEKNELDAHDKNKNQDS